MSFGRFYKTHCYSLNGDKYRVEIWDDNITSNYDNEFSMGAAGPQIVYEGEDDSKFTGIIASRCEVPFMVENEAQEFIIGQWRQNREEKQVYVMIYVNDGSSNSFPLWCGWLQTNLQNKEGQFFPYEITLTFVDGLAQLKEVDFIPEPDDYSPPYDKDNTYIQEIADAGQLTRTFIGWIQRILAHCGQAETTTGAERNWQYSSSLDWYNEHMTTIDVGADPLNLTAIKPHQFYEANDDGTYKARSCYEVLSDFCRMWGMRLIYWKHRYHFIGVNVYATDESGTLASPVNVNTRIYNKNGVAQSPKEYIGDKQYSRYQQYIYSAFDKNTGIQKLTGEEIGNYPTISEVALDFFTLGNYNFYDGFPPLRTTTEDYATNTSYTTTKSLGTQTDASALGGFAFKVQMQWNKTGLTYALAGNWVKVNYNFTVRARTLGATSWAKMIKRDSSGNLIWDTYSAPTNSASGFELAFFGTHEIIIGSMGYQFISANETLPTDAAFTGDWEFELMSFGYTGATANHPTSGAANFYITMNGHGACWTNTILGSSTLKATPNADSAVTTPYNIYTYNDLSIASNSSYFSGIISGAIGADGIKTIVRVTNTEDDFKEQVDDLFWGDSESGTSASALRIYDGSSWAWSDFGGMWGVNTVGGSSTITALLGEQMVNTHQRDPEKMSVTLALPRKGKWQADSSGAKRNYLNPIGRLGGDVVYNSVSQTYTGRTFWVFATGTFHLVKDEVEGTWFEETYDRPTTNITTSSTNGNNSGPVSYPPLPSSGTGSALVGPFGPSSTSMTTVTSTNAFYPVSSSPITSIAINIIGTALFTTDDVLELFDPITGATHDITLASDQAASDVTLTIDSLAYTEPIHSGSLVRLSADDCAVQYQRKSRGTVGGVTVTASKFGPISWSAEDSAYKIVGVDTEYIKILPSDFMANTGGGTTKSLQFNDSGTTGVKPGSNSTHLWAFVSIPYGKQAIDVTIYGNGTKATNVYEMDINASGLGSAIGTGNVGTTIDITDTSSDATNFLAIEVETDSTGNRIYGGLVNLNDI